jgi:mRNA interferase MazF
MALTYYPSAGEILVCHYDKEHDVFDGEMCKSRPVVVVGPRLRQRGKVVTVVPLSTTEPLPLETFQWKLVIAQTLPAPFHSPVMWAKCDMVSAVALERLDRFKQPQVRYGGPRKWTSSKVTPEQLKEVRAAILCGLGLSSLTIYV